jgi:hypothetical protein
MLLHRHPTRLFGFADRGQPRTTRRDTMQSLSIVIGIGGMSATIAVAVGAGVFVQYLARQHSRRTLQSYAELRGWKEVAARSCGDGRRLRLAKTPSCPTGRPPGNGRCGAMPA